MGSHTARACLKIQFPTNYDAHLTENNFQTRSREGWLSMETEGREWPMW